MLVLSYVLSPFIFIYDAYESIHRNFPVTVKRNKRKCLVDKNDKRYHSILKKIPGGEIKENMKPFLESKKLRNDLIFVESITSGFCSAEGNNDFTSGQAVIYSHPGFYELDRDACRWVMKHEISHIINNDNFINPLVSSICSIVTTVFSISFMPLVTSWGITIAIGNLADLALCQYMEVRADEFAIQSSSNEELKGGRRFMIALAEAQAEMRQDFSSKLLISPDGDLRFNFTHPSTSSRIAMIEKALQARKIVVYENNEKILIKRIKKLINTWLKSF